MTDLEEDNHFTDADWLALANSYTFEGFVKRKAPQLYDPLYKEKKRLEELEAHNEVNNMVVDEVCEELAEVKKQLAEINKLVFDSSPTLSKIEVKGFQQSNKGRGKVYDPTAIVNLKKEGYTHKKIAELLNCSESTVKRALKSEKK